jgi:glutamate formiminotransferase
MPQRLVECVPNYSEGRDATKIDSLAGIIEAVPEVVLLDRQSDADHNRSVMTFAGPPEAVAEAALRAVERAATLIDLTKHRGAHPRMGAADVVPFIPLEGVTLAECAEIAVRVGNEIWSRLRIPVFLYGAAARRPERVNLENIRRGQFEALLAEMGTVPARDPDIGLAVCHPTAGAVAVGARTFLIACNVNLGTADVAIAKRIARTIRFSSGGLRHVKAIGLLLASQNLAQVSINLTDFEETPIHAVFEAVRREAERYGAPVVETEIVGLIPRRAFEMSADYFRRYGNSAAGQILEDRMAEDGKRRQR